MELEVLKHVFNL